MEIVIAMKPESARNRTMTLIDDVMAHVDSDWIADLAERLVRIPSVTLHETVVCDCFANELRELGLEVDVREVTPGRPNLYARIPGCGGGPTLMLNGHLDTIPNQNNQPVFREGDRLYGRGSTDMKGGMAAMLGAVRALTRADVQLQGDLLLTAIVGHEEPEANKDGPLALIDDIKSGRIACDRIVIVEGPPALWVMSMGSMVFTITLESKRGGVHTQYVPFSENPIRFLGDMISRIAEIQTQLDHGDVHPLAGAERIDLGIVNAGDYFNRTAHRCQLVGNRRWAPGRQVRGVADELRSQLEPIAIAGQLDMTLTYEHDREPFETPAEDPVVQAVSAAHRSVAGVAPDVIGKRIVGDANLYVHGCGVPTIYYGPSNETAHADVENVSIKDMASVAAVYALAAMNYCGVATASKAAPA